MNQRKISSTRIDMTGKLYNSWKIIEIDLEKTKGKVIYWKAQCIEAGCNKIHSVHGANVRNGLSKRCLDCGNKIGHDKQKGTIRTEKTPKQMAYHYLLNNLKKDAKKRGQAWELSLEDMIVLVSSKCFYGGEEPSLVCYPLKYMGLSQKNTEEAVITRGGIDRIDSSKGYIKGNVVPCCEMCNKAKRDKSAEYFREWLLNAADFQRSKLTK